MDNPKTTNKRRLQGTVVSDKMTGTVVVRVERLVEHPRYKKRLRIWKKYKAHDEGNAHKEGDVVTIEECRPISKDKRFRVIS